MFNKLKKRLDEVETELKRLQKPETDYHTETILDYLIGDDMNCPICGRRMKFNTTVCTTRYYPTVVHHSLVCPNDKFTVYGNSLKACIDQLNSIEVIKTEN